MACPPGSDRALGPLVDERCRNFDLTLQFEDVFLFSLPSILFLLLAPTCIFQLLKSRAAFSVRSRALRGSKLLILTALIFAQAAFLVSRSRNELAQSNGSLAADVLGILASITAAVLSLTSHQRSLRPSSVLALFLTYSVLTNLIRARTLWLLAGGTREATAQTAVLGITVVSLLLESIEDSKALVNLGAPEEFSGIWTRTAFIWLLPVLKMGYSKIIFLDDLPQLDTKLEARVLQWQLISAWAHYNQNDRHSLIKACIRSYLPSLLSAIVPRLAISAFTFSQPFLISTTINLMDREHIGINHIRGLVGAWAFVYIGIAVSQSICSYQTSRFLTRMRGGLIALVYQHCLEIRAVYSGDITAVALISTDVERIVSGMRALHDTWGSLLDLAIACWLLGRQLESACFAPILLILIFIGVTSKVSVATQSAQRKWIEGVQERLRHTSAMLGDIKAIKMLNLSQVVCDILTKFRVDEIQTSRSFRKLLITTMLLSLAPINLAAVVTLAVYVLISVYWGTGTLLTAQAFASLALITLLTSPVILFIQSMPSVIQSISSFDRIQEYCNYASDSSSRKGWASKLLHAEPEISLLDQDAVEETSLHGRQTIALRNASFARGKTGTVVLKGLNAEIKQSAITAIIGSVGSGKSSLLNSILGEMIIHGELGGVRTATEHIAYCAQQPWLENGTIRQNIIGISSYKKQWYDEVVSSCGLDADIRQLRQGDHTRIGSKGLNMSGGQKQRIALARAVYSKRRMAVLDDVFSGMDAQTTSIVATRLLGRDGIFRKLHTTVILATHNRKIMTLADAIIVLEDGRIVENDVATQSFKSSGRDPKLSSQPLNEDHVVMIQEVENGPAAPGELTATAGIEESLAEVASYEPNTRRIQGALSVYSYYLTKSGLGSVFLYLFAVVGWIFCMEFSVIWMKWWSAANSVQPNKNVWMYLGIYALLGLLGCLSAWLAAWTAFISMISRSAAKLHSVLLQSTLKAPFRYFSATDTGELINRFSRDIELIDMELSSSMVNYTSTVVSIVAKVVMLAIFSKFLGPVIPIFSAFVYFLQKFYLHTSRQVRLLAIEAQAPLLTQISESVAGASTIRAFGWKPYYQERNYRLINASQRPVYIQHCLQQWLGFCLELMTAALAVILITTVLFWKDKFGPGSVGVSLVTVVGFSETLVRLIGSWTEVEPSIGAVARVKKIEEDTATEEKDEKGACIPADWPQAGSIEFSNLVACYGIEPHSKAVINSISLSVQPRQHIAICGGTGSGKTSLILALLRMIETKHGQITVDGVDISSLTCADIRSCINVVPQDPFLMPGSIRFNIDPFLTAAEEEIIYALKRVKLWAMIQESGGLDQEMNANDWSSGQKQLICLARAMVRKSKILVLDEAMSSVDGETENMMQDIIDSDFKDITVLAVMHRLEHIRSYDRAVLLGEGTVLETGDPQSLMAQDTRFSELYWLNAM